MVSRERRMRGDSESWVASKRCRSEERSGDSEVRREGSRQLPRRLSPADGRPVDDSCSRAVARSRRDRERGDRRMIGSRGRSKLGCIRAEGPGTGNRRGEWARGERMVEFRRGGGREDGVGVAVKSQERRRGSLAGVGGERGAAARGLRAGVYRERRERSKGDGRLGEGRVGGSGAGSLRSSVGRCRNEGNLVAVVCELKQREGSEKSDGGDGTKVSVRKLLLPRSHSLQREPGGRGSCTNLCGCA